MLGNRQRKEELEQLKQDVAARADEAKGLQEDVKAQRSRIQEQQDFLDKLSKRHDELMRRFSEELDTLKGTNEQARAEVHNLRTARVELKEDVTERFQQQLTKSVRNMEGKLEADTSKVESLSESLQAVTKELKDARAEIGKFKDLAETVKESDFRLKEHAKALEQADQEKLRLMKRVDELESMMAKMKQRRH